MLRPAALNLGRLRTPQIPSRSRVLDTQGIRVRDNRPRQNSVGTATKGTSIYGYTIKAWRERSQEEAWDWQRWGSYAQEPGQDGRFGVGSGFRV